MKIALLQLNPLVGDLEGNTQKIIAGLTRARTHRCELIVTAELAICGYPPRDLLLDPHFLKQSQTALKKIVRAVRDELLLVGGVYEKKGQLYNGAYALHKGRVLQFIGKKLLPTYDVFDESRYFTPFEGSQILKFKNKKIGVTICEDIWNTGDKKFKEYLIDPLALLKKEKVDLIVNLSASPFDGNKMSQRLKLLATQARRVKVPIVYVNQVGANDELVFDGRSLVVNANGKPCFMARAFQEDEVYGDAYNTTQRPQINYLEDLKQALVLGLRDYVSKCGFKKVVLGLSGGIDSALVAHLAVLALGPENVMGLLMPSRYTSQDSIDDALELAKNLSISTQTAPIEGIYQSFIDSFDSLFTNGKPDTTEENIQARIRGNLLMAVSNKEGHLVLSTGNKSELSVGYCTLYGDMAGGLAVIGDLPKMQVYALARYLNRQGVIPERIFTKPPTAELRENQTDQDFLPPYEQLDAILELLLEKHQSVSQITKRGFDKKTVEKIQRLVKINEYKRRQAAPILKVSAKAFGSGRRYPLASFLEQSLKRNTQK